MTDRDEDLGRALREMEVPDHGPGFMDTLRTRIADGEAAPARQARRRRRFPVVARLAAAGMAIAIAVGVTLTQVPPSESPPLGPANAKLVAQRVTGALATAGTLRGEMILTSDDPALGRGEVRTRFVVTAEGDLRQTEIRESGERSVGVYDARENIERYCFSPEPGAPSPTPMCSETRGLALGRPDRSAADWTLGRELGSVVRALLAAGDPAVRETTYEGRAAWSLETPVRSSLIDPDRSPDRFEITVDQQTGFPVRRVATKAGVFLHEMRVEDLVVDGPVARDEFTLAFPPGAEIRRSDEGFDRVTLDEAAARAGYAPLLPGTVPDGFEIAETVVAVDPATPFTGTEGGNPPSDNVVQTLYRRGFDRLLVTTRLRSTEDAIVRWTDPLSSGEGYPDTPERLTLDAGALDGAKAELLVDPLVVPHIWALGEELVVTISGDLSRDELVAAARSLAAHG